MKKSKKMAIVLFVILAIVVLDIPGKIFTKNINNTTEIQTISTMTDEEVSEYISEIPGQKINLDDYYEELKNIPSDIDGLSQYDKAAMGLDESDDSDSDGDGLTDREEIEVYGSDPLKSSTAGDLYLDSYKVEHGMDLHTYYEYENMDDFYIVSAERDGEIVEIDLHSDFVKLRPTAPESALVSINLDGEAVPENFEIYQELRIWNFEGTLSLDFSARENLKDLTDFDIAVLDIDDYMYYCDYDIDENGWVSLDYEFSYLSEYRIIIGKSLDPLKDTKKQNHECISYYNDYSRTSSGFSTSVDVSLNERYLVLNSPILNLIDIPASIYYACDNEPGKIEDVKAYANYIFGGGKPENLLIETKLKTNKGLNFLYSALCHVLSYFEYDGTDFKYRHFIFCYFDYDKAVVNSSLADINENSIVNFSPEIDELPFSNFASEYSEDGNCLGIAHLTSYLYNNKEFPSSGSYTIDNKAVQWDLTTDEENATLLDSGLSDYKSTEFVENYKLPDSLSNGEQEFVKMIGCYWAEGNDKVSLNNYMLKTKKSYDYSLVQYMMAYIDNGKILDVYFLFDNGIGHAINIYDYYIDDVDKDIIHFKVYDSNFPLSFISDNPYVFNSFVLDIKRERNFWGLYKTFTYSYHPITTDLTYKASTKGHRFLFSRKFAMIVVDDQWNVLNDQ